MTDIAEVGIAFDTRQIKEGIRDFDRLNTTGEETSRVMKDLNRNMGQVSNTAISAGRGMNRFGVVTQQVGYQVGDFVVQVQSGTNAFVAFGQQATQLAGLLYLIPGAMGAVVGTAASILIPTLTAVLAYFSRTSEAADNTRQAFDDLKKQTTETANEIERLARGLGSISELEALREQQRLEQELVALREQRASADPESIVFLEAQITALEEQIAANQQIIDSYRQQNQLLEVREELQEKDKIRQQQLQIIREREHNALVAVANALKEQVGQQERFNQKLKDAYGLYANLRMQAQGLAEDTRLAAIKFLEMRQFEGTAAGQALGRYGGRGTTSGRALVANFDMTPERQNQRLRQTIDLTTELTDAERQRLDLIQSIENSMESGFMAMVDGTRSVKDAFRSMARDIIAELYRVYVVQRIVGAISGRLFPGPAMLAPGIPVPPIPVRAAGGSIMSGGSYLVGEKGPEIIRPRHSGTVVPAHLSGQGGSSMTVNNNITVTGSDAANVRMEVAKMIPQITEATKAAVIDARRRGGQMKAAFG